MATFSRTTLGAVFFLFAHDALASTGTETSQNTEKNIVSQYIKEVVDNSHTDAYASLLFLKPQADNLSSSVFVSGNQPYNQSWYYQAIRPSYSPAFEVGLFNQTPEADFRNYISWLHLTSSANHVKQANQSIALSTVQFVGPDYEVGPLAFGIKRVTGKAQFDFDSVLVDVEKSFQPSAKWKFNLLGGVNILRIKQTLTSIYNDYAGTEPTPVSYGTLPDPSYNLRDQNTSSFWGIGPNIELDAHYLIGFKNNEKHLGLVGRFLGTITVGSQTVSEHFRATSQHITNQGLGTINQWISVPSATKVVPGFDGRLGVYYDIEQEKLPKLNVELGYRMASYINAITQVRPTSLVQPGTASTVPGLSTGTMAIQSTGIKSLSFNFNGPYLTLNAVIR